MAIRLYIVGLQIPPISESRGSRFLIGPHCFGRLPASGSGGIIFIVASLNRVKSPFAVNLDETAIRRSPHEAVGLIVPPELWWDNDSLPSSPVNRQHLRGMVSHIALCCHRPDVQGRLPQASLGNHRMFSASLIHDIIPDLPPSVKIFGEGAQVGTPLTSWNASLMRSRL